MSNNIKLKKGLNVPITGAACLEVTQNVVPDVVAVCPDNFKGLLPRLLVREGDKVLAGSPILSDKKASDILVTSPVSGTVKEIVRGEKRALLAVLIELDTVQQYQDFGPFAAPAALTADEVKQALLKSGLWTAIVQRPYGIIANPAATPKAIFVSGFNTAPLAAKMDFVLEGETAAVQAGITALSKIAGVHLSLCAKCQAESPLAKIKDAEIHFFEGKHPAGNVGVQISNISPICKEETVWTVSLPMVAAIGKLLSKGICDLRRKVAVTGPMAVEPSYILAYPGTPIKALAPYYGTMADSIRFVSGDPLSGKNVGIDGYLRFQDNQICFLKEGNEKEYFGWIRPIRYKQFSTDHCYFSWLTPWRKYNMDTNLHGGPRAFIMNDAYYGKVLPMDLFPLYLTKACLAGDIDKMEKFGIYEVLPEDLALCEFVDPSKNNIQDIIAKGIDLMLKEMA